MTMAKRQRQRIIHPTPQQQQQHHHPSSNNNDDDSSDSGSDIFSPYPAFRPSLIPKSPGNEILPPLHDSSWIGARMSPIKSYDDDDDADNHNHHKDASLDIEDQIYTEPFRKAIHPQQQQQAQSTNIGIPLPSQSNNFVTNERTALLPKNMMMMIPNDENGSQIGIGYNYNTNIGSKNIHPLWENGQKEIIDAAHADARIHHKNRRRKNNTCFSSIHWGKIVCVNSGIYLGCIGIYDLYLWYISYRLGLSTTTTTTNTDYYDVDSTSSTPSYFVWKLPFLYPNEATLITFGAFDSDLVLFNNQYWRILSSTFLCTSVVEWLLVLWSWHLIEQQYYKNSSFNSNQNATNKPNFFILYVLCIITGQFWMLAWDTKDISGCASWGTCGILCAVGVDKPKNRFVFFVVTIIIIILSLLEQPYSSVLGIIGSSFFGWAFYGCGLFINLSSKNNSQPHNNYDNNISLSLSSSSHQQYEQPTRRRRHGGGASNGLLRLFSLLIVLLLWILPLLRIAVREDYI